MQIYEHRTDMTVTAGAVSTTTLNVFGGILRQVLIRALTSGTTTFKADLLDDHNVKRREYDFHEGEINDMKSTFPMVGPYTISITNASADETFRIILAVAE